MMPSTSTSATTPTSAPDLGELLRNYFDGRTVGIAPNDPATRLAEGFLVQVIVKSWGGRVRLGPEDWGLSVDAYQALESALRWGSLSLLDETLQRKLSSIAVQARTLPVKWGRRTYWGRYIPLTAMGRFKDAFAALEAEWQSVLNEWIAHYDSYRALAEARVRQMAEQAQVVALQLQAGLQIEPEEMVERLLSEYPLAEEIENRSTLSYSVTFIPSPALTAAQAAQLEIIELEKQQKLVQMRQEAEQRSYDHELARVQTLSAIDVEEAKQREKLRVIEAEKLRLQRELEQERKKLLDEFYRGYALDIRQRLHEALMFVVEGVRRGKVAPSAGRSLRTVLDEIALLALDDDQEIQQMRTRLQALLGEPGQSGKADAIKQSIEDMGVLLQTSILALGEQPRMPRRKGVEVAPQDVLAELPAEADAFRAEVRSARERAGLDSSLAETLIESVTLDDLRRRPRRGLDQGDAGEQARER